MSKQIRFVVLGLFLLFSVRTSSVTAEPLQTIAQTSQFIPGVNQISISHVIEGVSVSRPVFIRVPINFSSTQRYPVLFGFHGANGRGNQFLSNQVLNGLIDSGEFIGVYPNGYANDGSTGGFWNLGTEPTTADDIEFVGLIIDRLSTYATVDLSRTYAFGFSNGAGMVNLLGKSTSHFKGIAPLFSQQSTTTVLLSPPAALSVFQVNGANDPLIPLNGGTSQVGVFVSAEESAQDWATRFSCPATPVSSTMTWGQTTLNSSVYENCISNQEVRYYIALQTGHGSMDIEMNNQMFREVWEFFDRAIEAPTETRWSIH
jgi:polyhydroxybutyrate depolymerase